MDRVEGNWGYDQNVLQEVRNQQSALLQTLAQFQLNFTDEIERVENLFKGKVYDEGKRSYVQRYDPMMNDVGIAYFMVFIRTWMNKMVAQSSYDSKEVNKWCLSFWKQICIDIYQYADDWELDVYLHGNFIKTIVFNCLTMMNGAKEGGLREVVGKISKVVETSHVNMPDIHKKTSL